MFEESSLNRIHSCEGCNCSDCIQPTGMLLAVPAEPAGTGRLFKGRRS
jgi:hypothetical protein